MYLSKYWKRLKKTLFQNVQRGTGSKHEEFMEQETRKKLEYSKSGDFKELLELGQILSFL